MCLCLAPVIWPYLLPALTVLAGLLYLTVRGTVAIVLAPVVAWLERRSDRIWNEGMAEIYPHLRGEIPTRRRVDVTVVRPEPAAIEPAPPLAITSAAVRIYATPRKELQR